MLRSPCAHSCVASRIIRADTSDFRYVSTGDEEEEDDEEEEEEEEFDEEAEGEDDAAEENGADGK